MRNRLLYIILGTFFVAQLACARRTPPAANSTPNAANEQAQLVDQILDRYREAIGGQAAIDRVTSYKAEGTFESSVLREQGKFSSWGKEPHKTLSVIEFPRIGTLRKGFDG